MESNNKVKIFTRNEMVTIIESLRRNRDFHIDAIKKVEDLIKHPLKINSEQHHLELLELKNELRDCLALLSRIDDEGLI